MITGGSFVDSNIILYLMDDNELKKSVSEKILVARPSISAQILTEVANVCKRRFKYTKEEVLALWSVLLTDCTFVPTHRSTFRLAIRLAHEYHFQLYDAVIVAAALEYGASVIYSEDMQHNMEIERQLRILNPFV